VTLVTPLVTAKTLVIPILLSSVTSVTSENRKKVVRDKKE
jgi:hypothetical protein